MAALDRRCVLVAWIACLLAFGSACGPRRPADLVSEPPPEASAAPEASMPAEESAPPAVEALWERDQVSLSEAERLLAENRARLRAAGIVAAAASDADESVSEGVAGGVAGGALGGSAVGKNGGGAPQEKHARPSAPAQGYGGAASSSPAKRKDAAARAPTPWPASEAPAGDDAGGVCLRICELTAATCELKARICALASRHAGDARYEAVCTQATTDCALASRACSSCAA